MGIWAQSHKRRRTLRRQGTWPGVAVRPEQSVGRSCGVPVSRPGGCLFGGGSLADRVGSTEPCYPRIALAIPPPPDPVAENRIVQGLASLQRLEGMASFGGCPRRLRGLVVRTLRSCSTQ